MDYRDTYNVAMGVDDAYCLPPVEILLDCTHSTRHELTMDARWFPNTAGQWLWNHLSFAMNKYPETINEGQRGQMKHTIAEIFGFEARTDPSRRRPTTIAMVERLLRQYEAREFSDEMLKVWDEAKAHQHALQQQNAKSEYYCMMASEEYIQKWFHRSLTPKKQRERIAQWNLI